MIETNILELCSIKARIGWQGLRSDEFLSHGYFSLVTGTDIKDGKVDWSSTYYVSQERYSQDTSIQLKLGDILISKDGTIGKIGYIDYLPNKATLNSGVYVVRSKNQDVIRNDFLSWFFRSCYFENFISELRAGSTISHLYQKDFVKLNIIFPESTNEQSQIAEALSDVDALIGELDVLIEKKLSVIQGTMQDLLTARRRLPGFTDPWVDVAFSDLGFTYNGLSGKTGADFGHGESKFIMFVNVIYKDTISPQYFDSVDISKGEKQNKVHKNDLIFNTSSETPEEVGMCSCVTEDYDNLYLNSFCFGFRFYEFNTNARFIAFLLRSRIGRDLMMELAQGSTRYNLPKRKFLSSKIMLPKQKQEQDAIAAILSDMDAEIDELVAKRDKYVAVRQGMIQQLLTGKIRLI